MGEFLLLNALHRSLVQAQQIASSAVVVDAKDQNAEHFYLHFNFQPFQLTPLRLFLPMGQIGKIFLEPFCILTPQRSMLALHLLLVNYVGKPVLEYLPSSGTVTPSHGIISRIAENNLHTCPNRFGRLLLLKNQINLNLGIIRRWHIRDQVPLREIARRLGISRNTVRRYLRSETIEPAYAERRSARAIDKYAKCERFPEYLNLPPTATPS